MTPDAGSGEQNDVKTHFGVFPDIRFFRHVGARSASALAVLCDGVCLGNPDIEVDTVGALQNAGDRALSYCEDVKKSASLLQETKAAIVIAPLKAKEALSGAAFTAILCKNPKGAFAVAAKALVEERQLSGQIAIHPDARIGANVVVEPGAIIGAGVQIGDDSRIGANAVIRCGVAIGKGVTVGSGASVQCALVGDGVTIGPNAVVGHAGFGLATVAGQSIDMPQFGRAVLQDGVSLGAGSCVDRGAFADTIVGEGTKIDNLVHIGHNCVIGRNVIIVACSGISGSVTIGDNAVLGGAVGVADHLNIGAGSILVARSGVICDIPPGEVWAGTPARPRRQWLREAAWLSRAARRPTDK